MIINLSNVRHQVWFTSDWHALRASVIRYCPTFRQGWSEKDQASRLIALNNATVADEDIVFHLGDLTFSKDWAANAAFLGALKGRHYLVLGNHDDGFFDADAQDYYQNQCKIDGSPLLEGIGDYAELYIKNYCPAGGVPLERTILMLSHYPMIEWHRQHRGAYHLYGHLHDGIAPVKGRALNVGYDLHGRMLSLHDVNDFLHDLPVPDLEKREIAYRPTTDITRNAENLWQQLRRLNR